MSWPCAHRTGSEPVRDRLKSTPKIGPSTNFSRRYDLPVVHSAWSMFLAITSLGFTFLAVTLEPLSRTRSQSLRTRSKYRAQLLLPAVFRVGCHELSWADDTRVTPDVYYLWNQGQLGS